MQVVLHQPPLTPRIVSTRSSEKLRSMIARAPVFDVALTSPASIVESTTETESVSSKVSMLPLTNVLRITTPVVAMSRPQLTVFESMTVFGTVIEHGPV